MKKLFKFFAVTLVSAAAISLSACGEDKPDGGEVTEEILSVDPETLTFASDDAEPQTVKVTSTSPWTAKVSDGWIVISPASGVSDGNITVTVEAGSGARSGSVTVESGELSETVTVNQEPPVFIPVTDVELDKTSLEMRIGDEVQLTATVIPEEATNMEVIWDSSEDAIATVDENGLVKAVAPGPVTITVVTVDGNHEAFCEITVLSPEIYIVGAETDSSYVTYAWMWHDGVLERVSNNRSEAFFVTVSGDDVYVAGRESSSPSDYLQLATVWKNGEARKLGVLNSFARSVFVSGDDVYVCGMENDADYVSHATVWLNGQPQVLSPNHSDAKSIVVAGNDVYVAGEEMGADNKTYATIWKNGEAIRLSDNASSALSVYVSGDDVHVAWFETIAGEMGSSDFARIWKNGVSRDLDDTPAHPNGLYVDGEDVYVAGITYADRDMNGNATLWVNGESLPLSSSLSSAAALSVSGSDIYAVGEDSGSGSVKHAILWKNSAAETVNTNDSRANSIFVR